MLFFIEAHYQLNLVSEHTYLMQVVTTLGQIIYLGIKKHYFMLLVKLPNLCVPFSLLQWLLPQQPNWIYPAQTHPIHHTKHINQLLRKFSIFAPQLPCHFQHQKLFCYFSIRMYGLLRLITPNHKSTYDMTQKYIMQIAIGFLDSKAFILIWYLQMVQTGIQCHESKQNFSATNNA